MIFEGTVVISLQKPIKWEGQTHNEVRLDFSRVTGKTIIDAEREVFQGGSLTIVRTMSADYCTHIAAAISGLPYRALIKLSSVDFDSVWQTVSAFVGNRDPQEFYNQFIGKDDYKEDTDEEDKEDEKGEDEETGFTEPAAEPEE